MTTVKAQAPAKINLTLHVTGEREDGYHLLDSLVVFADVGDDLTAAIAPDLKLSLSGPGTNGVPTDETNLVLRAALALQKARGVTDGAAITLHKYLPIAAGVGGGSSDAAATLTMLAELWNVDPLAANAPEVVALGADVPVCLRSPRPTRMSGIGDVLADVPELPNAALVLVNPGVSVPTSSVFDGLATKTNRAMRSVPSDLDFAGFVEWLAAQRNDLIAPAKVVAPEVETALAKLASMSQVAFSGMSGSGATCFGLVPTMSDARYVARAIQLAHSTWWVAPAKLLK